MIQILRVDRLAVSLSQRDGEVRIVDDVSMELTQGQVHGLVGESGCGKSIFARAIMNLLPAGISITGGRILLRDQEDLAAANDRRMRRVRGGEIGFIFQDASSSLDPTMPVGKQIAEAASVHLGVGRKEAAERALELLHKVGIPSPRQRIDDFSHQFSGGMRQRVMIATALAGDPSILLADEPTTALDVTIQAQILELLQTLTDEFGMAVLLITHDLGVAARVCHHLSVMYAGKIVETGRIEDVFERPSMPYTEGLLGSVPRLDTPRGARLLSIAGQPPSLRNRPRGCRFAPRCSYRHDVCDQSEPELDPRERDHAARCYGTRADGWISRAI